MKPDEIIARSNIYTQRDIFRNVDLEQAFWELDNAFKTKGSDCLKMKGVIGNIVLDLIEDMGYYPVKDMRYNGIVKTIMLSKEEVKELANHQEPEPSKFSISITNDEDMEIYGTLLATQTVYKPFLKLFKRWHYSVEVYRTAKNRKYIVVTTSKDKHGKEVTKAVNLDDIVELAHYIGFDSHGKALLDRLGIGYCNTYD